MANHKDLKSLFTAMADAIRTRTGNTEPIIADNFPTEIENLRTGFDYNNTEVTELPDHAFYGCEDLNSIDCPSLTTIGASAFEGCTNLKSATLHESVTSVGENAFKDCDEDLIINCMFSSKPDGWDENWNPNNYEVVWKDTYTPLSYLKFNADMVFDTGVICNQDTKLEVRFTRETSESRAFFGVNSSGNTATVSATLATNGEWRFGGAYKKLTMSNATTQRNVTMSKANMTYGGTTYAYTGTVGTFTCPYTLTIGSARATDGTIAAPTFIGKLYYFKIYNNDTLIRDYVPATNSAGISGLYDNVTGKFIIPV